MKKDGLTEEGITCSMISIEYPYLLPHLMGHDGHRWNTPWRGRLYLARTTWTAKCERGGFPS
jgi:hypothetical protein